MRAPSRPNRRFVLGAALAVGLGLGATGAQAVDPPYEAQMERLTHIMGSLYFLQPLCKPSQIDWRAQAASLIDADQPDDDRRQRLNGSFNDGYSAFARLYNRCTPSAREALDRLLTEAESLARDIHSRYAQ